MPNTLEITGNPNPNINVTNPIPPLKLPAPPLGYCRLSHLPLIDFHQISNAYDDCFMMVGMKYGIDWRLLKAIASHESGRALNPMSDSGVAYGIMQINYRQPNPMFTKSQLMMMDGCQQIDAGAQILMGFLKRFPLKQAIYAYNGGTKRATMPTSANINYELSIRDTLATLQSG